MWVGFHWNLPYTKGLRSDPYKSPQQYGIQNIQKTFKMELQNNQSASLYLITDLDQTWWSCEWS